MAINKPGPPHALAAWARARGRGKSEQRPRGRVATNLRGSTPEERAHEALQKMGTTAQHWAPSP
eukprot:3407709-Alexandrium_andersonii.AAC.1